MAQFAYDGNVRVAYLIGEDAIGDISAPTTAELNAGGVVDLSCLLPKDGWQPGNNTNSVEAGKLCQTFDASVPGTWGGPIAAKFFRDSVEANDLAWNTFEYGQVGFAVVRYGLPHTTAWADGQRVEVWPTQAQQPQMDQTATNTNARFSITFDGRSQPDLYAVVGGAGS